MRKTAVVQPAGSPVPWDFEYLNGVYRLRHNFMNFCGNAGFETWSNGEDSYPDSWFNAGGDVIPHRVSNPSQGAYACQITLNSTSPTSYSGMGTSWGAYNQYVSFTASLYYKKISGNESNYVGLILLQQEPPYTIFATCPFENTIDGNFRLAAASFTVPVAANGKTSLMRIGAISDSTESVWVIDEVMLQESNGIATTWIPSAVWDTGDQMIAGKKTLFDDMEFNSNGNGIVQKSPDGSRWRIGIADDGTISATKL